MKTLSLILAAALSVLLAPLTAAAGNVVKNDAATPKVKNVILVTIDTLRADYLGLNGGKARTPTLDRLGRQGWSFGECISTSMITNPSHASIMTSLYPRDHGVQDNESGIGNGINTIAAALSRRGFATGAVIGFPHLNPKVSNLGQGFDRVKKATRKEMRADATSRATLAMVDSLSKDHGFFVWAHYVDPHAPYDPPASHPPRAETATGNTPIDAAVRSSPGFQRNNPWFKRAFREHRTVQQLVRKYVAEIEATDAGLAVLLDGLRERDLLDSTALVITSDHGENMGEHGLYFHHGGLYRPTVHVPLLVSAPGLTPVRIDEPVSTVDIAPTILAMVGAPRWEPMRGTDLALMAVGGQKGRQFVYSEHMMAQGLSVRSKEGTLILHRKTTRQFPSYRFRAGRKELYSRIRDPDELHPLGLDSVLAQDLDAALDDYLGLGLRLSARPAIEQDRESLRALGYIQ